MDTIDTVVVIMALVYIGVMIVHLGTECAQKI